MMNRTCYFNHSATEHSTHGYIIRRISPLTDKHTFLTSSGAFSKHEVEAKVFDNPDYIPRNLWKKLRLDRHHYTWVSVVFVTNVANSVMRTGNYTPVEGKQ